MNHDRFFECQTTDQSFKLERKNAIVGFLYLFFGSVQILETNKLCPTLEHLDIFLFPRMSIPKNQLQYC